MLVSVELGAVWYTENGCSKISNLDEKLFVCFLGGWSFIHRQQCLNFLMSA